MEGALQNFRSSSLKLNAMNPHEILLRKALKECERQRFQAFLEVIQLLWAHFTIAS
jgi:hypothetical protein